MLACVYATSFKTNKKVAYKNIVSTVEQTFIDEEISINEKRRKVSQE